MNKGKILITGATGATGGGAIEALQKQNVPIRAMVHQADARSEQLRVSGVEVVEGDLLDFDSVSEALKDVTSAYFVYPIQVTGLMQATAFFAQAALEQGVSAIVNMSQITARRDAKSHGSQSHWIAERLWDRSGVPVTHLRPTLFAEWLTYLSRAIREQHILPLAFGDGRYAPITGEDQGRVIAAILSNPSEHSGKTYPLFGPEELSQYEIADLLTQVLGYEITYVPMEIPAFTDMFKTLGFTSHFQQHIGHVAEDTRAGVCSGTNDLVEKLTGKKPIGMLEYIARNKALFTQSAAAGF